MHLEKDHVIDNLKNSLNKLIDTEYKENQFKYHSNEFLLLGVRTNYVRKLITETNKQIKSWNEKDVYNLIESLLQMNYNEYIIIGFGIAYKWTKNLRIDHFPIFESWLEKYVVDWGQCDDLCCGILGKVIYQFPQLIDGNLIQNWTKSENMWLRRASAVSMIISLRSGLYLSKAFIIADNLLMDDQDLVKKGYGWMLKEASKKFQNEVFKFVMERKRTMPRTALSYAIEKMDFTLKEQAMS